MKIAPKAADSYLAAPDARHHAVLLYGPDAGLALSRARALTRILLPGERDPFAYAEFTEAQLLADPARLADELRAISLTAPRRVIIVEDAGDKLARLIESAAEYFNAAAFLIVCADELSPRSPLRAWFEKADNAAAVACYRDEARDVQDITRKAFAAAGIEADRDTVEYLAQQLGNDRGVTLKEIEKLITYAGGENISLEEVRRLVDYNREAGLDEMINAVADKNMQALESMLTLLLREGTPPMAYLRALSRYFSRLYVIRSKMAAGQSAEEVIQGLRPPVFFKQVPALARHVHAWDETRIVKALKLLASAELACKTSDLPATAASSRRLMQVAQLR